MLPSGVDVLIMFFSQSSSCLTHDGAVNHIEGNLSPKHPVLPTLVQFSMVGTYCQETYFFSQIFPTMLLTNCLYCPFSSLLQCKVTVLSVQLKHLVIWCFLKALLAFSINFETIWVATNPNHSTIRSFFLIINSMRLSLLGLCFFENLRAWGRWVGWGQ